MTILEKILKALKTEAASLGFNEEELQSVAENISDNLSTQEDATDEDINAQIKAVMPVLKVAQKNANRVINKAKSSITKSEPMKGAEEPKKDDDEPAWFKKYREDSEKRIAQLESDKTLSIRRERLNEVVKDSGMFGTRTIKSFEKMNFASEEDFESFLNETRTDLEAYIKERSEAGLDVIPLGGGKPQSTPKKEASDQEVDDVASLI